MDWRLSGQPLAVYLQNAEDAARRAAKWRGPDGQYSPAQSPRARPSCDTTPPTRRSPSLGTRARHAASMTDKAELRAASSSFNSAIESSVGPSSSPTRSPPARRPPPRRSASPSIATPSMQPRRPQPGNGIKERSPSTFERELVDTDDDVAPPRPRASTGRAVTPSMQPRRPQAADPSMLSAVEQFEREMMDADDMGDADDDASTDHSQPVSAFVHHSPPTRRRAVTPPARMRPLHTEERAAARESRAPELPPPLYADSYSDPLALIVYQVTEGNIEVAFSTGGQPTSMVFDMQGSSFIAD